MPGFPLDHLPHLFLGFDSTRSSFKFRPHFGSSPALQRLDLYTSASVFNILQPEAGTHRPAFYFMILVSFNLVIHSSITSVPPPPPQQQQQQPIYHFMVPHLCIATVFLGFYCFICTGLRRRMIAKGRPFAKSIPQIV
jgi:hypothetical protein